MIQGTASHVGKSLIVTGLCRLFAEQGVRVAPFKAQNMALNAFVTPEGGEIAFAQALQAEAAMVPPEVDMNPILLKPKGQALAQVVLEGRPVRDMPARAYWQEGFEEAWQVVLRAFDRLASRYDLVLVEGAGSPAEVNLRPRDLANMRLALAREIPVLLVGDIERGGIFASLLGTLHLLTAEERGQVKGLLVNKFRGDPELFTEGLRFLESASQRPVVGVLPYLDLDLPAEDSLSLGAGRAATGPVRVAVIAYPHIANFTDFDALAQTPEVSVTFVRRLPELADVDAVILPGTKNTIDDLFWLYEEGFADRILMLRRQGVSLVGLCGGLQMLGERLEDPFGLEGTRGQRVVRGLGLLPIVTRFLPGKTTHQSEGRIIARGSSWQGLVVRGYEIHSGQSWWTAPGTAFARLTRRSGEPVAEEDGAFLDDDCFGTYLHGLFDDVSFRLAFVNRLRRKKGLPPLMTGLSTAAERRRQAFERLAQAFRQHLRLELLAEWTGISL